MVKPILYSLLLSISSLNATSATTAGLRLNQVQMKGSHNSYHQKPLIPFSPEWNYSHPNLYDQLRMYGIRQLELDVHLDPLRKRFRVYHLPVLDERTSCKKFQDCLREIADWSHDVGAHEPVFVFVETKGPIFSKHHAWNIAQRLDDEIRSVLPPGKLLVPDDIQGDAPDLRTAVTTKGWPMLDTVRGKFVFVLLDDERVAQYYTSGNRTLRGRAMFALSDGNQPISAIVSLTSPEVEGPRIQELVRQGFIVRTRSDSALEDPHDKPELAKSSGAQLISTDFIMPDSEFYFTLGPSRPVWRKNPLF